MNTDVLKNISYGVYVVSTYGENRSTGCIVNSIMQITRDIVAVSINHQNYTNERIKTTNKFIISILPEDIDDNVIPVFGFQCGRDVDKFSNIEKTTISGIDIIKNCIGYIVCEVVDAVETQTHTVFLAKIVDGDMLNNKPPMTYAYYHEIRKGLSPKTAPTYIDEQHKQTSGYRCKICGYVYSGDINLEPEDYVCPICKKPKSFFEKI